MIDESVEIDSEFSLYPSYPRWKWHSLLQKSATCGFLSNLGDFNEKKIDHAILEPVRHHCIWYIEQSSQRTIFTLRCVIYLEVTETRFSSLMRAITVLECHMGQVVHDRLFIYYFEASGIGFAVRCHLGTVVLSLNFSPGSEFGMIRYWDIKEGIKLGISNSDLVLGTTLLDSKMVTTLEVGSWELHNVWKEYRWARNWFDEDAMF